jgi:hypothetical protein
MFEEKSVESQHATESTSLESVNLDLRQSQPLSFRVARSTSDSV